MTQTTVRDAQDAHRFEALVEGAVAGFAEYRVDGETVVFTHTEVDSAYEGQGVGSALVRGALDTVRQDGRRVVARCEFVQSYLDRHPEYSGLVDEPGS